MYALKKYYLIIFLIFLTAEVYSQSVTCSYCGKKITGKYLVVDGKAFHPEHFICGKCGKPIEGAYQKFGLKYYHPECYSEIAGLICNVCKKPISGEYYENDGKKYHLKCYTDYIAVKCSVCGEPIMGEYYSDAFGNKYHRKHENEFPKCDNCNRLICKSITGGGVRYNDGREICNICFKKAVKNLSEYNSALVRVASTLRQFGLNIETGNISLKNVDRSELKRIAGSSYSNSMRGYCDTKIKTLKEGNRESRTTSHIIYILDKIPIDNIESILAHELMHVWIHQQTEIEHSSELEEGSCNYISYLYLKRKNNLNAEPLIKQLLSDPDPAYGDGFRKIKSLYEGKPLNSLLAFLKRNKSF